MSFKKIIISLLVLLTTTFLFGRTDYDYVLWDDYIILRDSVYNSEDSTQILPLYDKAIQSAETIFSEDSLFIAYSRCHYIMGRAYSYENNKEMAEQFYDKGEEVVKKALEIKESPAALIMFGENVSQNCSVKPVSYAITMGTKVGGFAQDVLKLDPNNGAALYMKNAQYIYAPSPFHNYGKGIREMKKILDNPQANCEKDDLFNITSAIGYGYKGKKDYDQAEIWLKKSLEYYPNNKYVNGLLQEIYDKQGR